MNCPSFFGREVTRSKSKFSIHRRSLRLPEYDYSWAGFYFVTIRTHNNSLFFGEIGEGGSILGEFGNIAFETWSQIPSHFHHVKIDSFIIMPNHIHGILQFKRRGTACRAPTFEQFGKPVAGSLPTVIRSYKSAVTRRINFLRSTPGAQVWQRNYYEHVIRNEESLNQLRRYIGENPLRWSLERENPLNA